MHFYTAMIYLVIRGGSSNPLFMNGSILAVVDQFFLLHTTSYRFIQIFRFY